MFNLKKPRKHLGLLVLLVLLGYGFICDLLLVNPLAPLTTVYSPICKHKHHTDLSGKSRGMSADLSGLLAVKAVSQPSSRDIERRHYLDQCDSPRTQSEPNLFFIVYRYNIRHSDSSKSLKRFMWYNIKLWLHIQTELQIWSSSLQTLFIITSTYL